MSESDTALDDLIAEALDLPSEGRDAYLDAACGTDSRLRFDVDRLLRELDDRDPFLRPGGAVEGPFGADLQSSLEESEALLPGTPVGAYRIVEPLARGGMAVVYRAERADGAFAQPVALKVLKRGIDSADVVARFRQERQILASLTHKDIARILDGGITDDGLPYFAMELVEGEPIDRFCDRERPGLGVRIDLCIAVARAVQHAHRHLVVHRDLKPSNILVTPEGTIKLLDFGIAKLLDPAADYAAPPTMTALRALTPQYASPEQVRGDAITTASDVYQLGLILYELLAGRRAHAVSGSSALAIERAVCEMEPPLPSTAVAGQRRLVRQLRGDLDTIVSTAINKDPVRRYASVEQFADDLVSYREGRPIKARRTSVARRAAKLIARRKLASGVAVATFLLVASIVLFYNVRLTAERDAARREAATATRVTDFITDIFRSTDPLETQGATITAGDLLKRGMGRIDRGLAGEPHVQARLQLVMGGVHASLGLFGDALPLIERSLASRRARLDPAHPEVAESLHALGSVLDSMGRFDAARVPLEEALRIRQQVLGPEHPDVGRTLLALGLLEERLGNHQEAARLVSSAVAVHERSLGAWHSTTADALASLGFVHSTGWRLGEAEAAYTRALAIYERNHGPEDYRVVRSLAALANTRRKAGNPRAARPALERAVAISERVYGADHPRTAAITNTFALLLADLGLHAEARVQFERSIDRYVRRLGPDHFQVAYPVENLGKTFRALGEPRRALALYTRALEIRVKAYGPIHVEVSQTLESEGTLRLEMKDHAGAERVLRRALDVTRRTFEPGHARIGRISSAMGACLTATGRLREAEPLLLEGLSILAARNGQGHPDTVLGRQRVIDLYTALGKPAQAARYRTGS